MTNETKSQNESGGFYSPEQNELMDRKLKLEVELLELQIELSKIKLVWSRANPLILSSPEKSPRLAGQGCMTDAHKAPNLERANP